MKSINMTTGQILEYKLLYNTVEIDLIKESYDTIVSDGNISYFFFLEMNNAFHTVEITVTKRINGEKINVKNIFLTDGTFHYRINTIKSLCIEIKSAAEIYVYRIDG